jgi:hypothetical protein
VEILLAEHNRTFIERFSLDVIAGDMVRVPLEIIFAKTAEPVENIPCFTIDYDLVLQQQSATLLLVLALAVLVTHHMP